MNKVIKMTAAAAAFSMAGTAAFAVTDVSIGDDVIEQGIVTAPDGSVQFDFVANEDFTIPGFSLSAVGNSGGTDIGKISVSFVPSNGDDTLLTTTGTIGDAGFGGGTLDGFNVAAGDTWSILFDVADGEEVARNVGVQLSFSPVAPIPLPAAGGLLLAALAAGGVVARRKK